MNLQTHRTLTAIKAEAFVNDAWKIFGTIKKSKVPKLTRALQQQEVVECKFLEPLKYALNVNGSGDNGLTCKLVLVKRSAWEIDDFIMQT